MIYTWYKYILVNIYSEYIFLYKYILVNIYKYIGIYTSTYVLVCTPLPLKYKGRFDIILMYKR